MIVGGHFDREGEATEASAAAAASGGGGGIAIAAGGRGSCGGRPGDFAFPHTGDRPLCHRERRGCFVGRLFGFLRRNVARQNRVRHRQVVRRHRGARRRLHQILRHDVPNLIVLGVMDEVVILSFLPALADFIPEEAGNAFGVERGMIARAAARHALAHVNLHRHFGEGLADRLNRRGEHGLHVGDALQAAVVIGAAIVDERRRDAGLFFIGQGLDIRLGAEQALLLASPQAEANGALGLDAGGIQNARGFKRGARAHAVVLRALRAGAIP